MVNKAIQKAIQSVGSQKKLAIHVGVSQPNVWSWLHNKKGFLLKMLTRL